MNVNHKLELLDQLDDAAFALMMDEYAEAEGERLRAEFEADMRAGLTPPMPEGLDEKCRKQIKAEYGRARWAEYGARARKMAVKAAAVLLIGIGIAAATVMSVEAIREPIWKAISEIRDGQLDIDLNKLKETEPSEFTPELQATFFNIVPDGYENVFYESENGRIMAMYENTSAQYYLFSMRYVLESDLAEAIYVEAIEHRYVTINGYKAELIIKEDSKYVTWHIADLETEFCISTDGLTTDELLLCVKDTISLFEAATLEGPTFVPDVLPTLLPERFYPFYSQMGTPGLLCAHYEDGADGRVIFSMFKMAGELSTNTEGCEVEESTLCGYDAIYIHGDFLAHQWYDEEREIIFQCTTYDFTEDDHLRLCESLANYYKDVTLPAPSTVIYP